MRQEPDRQGRSRPRGRPRRELRGPRRRDPRHRRRGRQRPGRDGRGAHRPAHADSRHASRLEGRTITGASPAGCTSSGVGFVPADRHRFGIVLSFPLTDNLVAERATTARRTRAASCGTTTRSARTPRRVIAEYDIRTPSANVTAGTLSGGNQQKVVVAREFDGEPSSSSSTSRLAASTSAASSSSTARRSPSATPAWRSCSSRPSWTRCSSCPTASASCSVDGS